MSVLITRLISSIILIPIFIGAVLLGHWPFIVVITGAALIAGWEYSQLLQKKRYAPSRIFLWAGILICMADAVFEIPQGLALGLIGLAFTSGVWQMFHREPEATANWALTLAGGLYLGLGGAYLIRLRMLPEGMWWTLLAFPTLWIADTGAYLIGKPWGRHKIAPAISPGKSWEGYAAEIVSGAVSGCFLGWWLPHLAGQPLTLTPLRGLLVGTVLALITPLGDFFESMIKREVGVKDSSNLIPGHGGMFDRIDSLLWTGLLTWGLVVWLFK